MQTTISNIIIMLLLILCFAPNLTAKYQPISALKNDNIIKKASKILIVFLIIPLIIPLFYMNENRRRLHLL